MATTTSTLKHETKAVIDALPDGVTANELWAALDAFLLRRKVEQGLAEARAGLGIPSDEVWAELEAEF